MCGGTAFWNISEVLATVVELSDRYIRVVTPLDSSDLHPVSAGVSQVPFGHHYYLIFTFACFQVYQNTV